MEIEVLLLPECASPSHRNAQKIEQIQVPCSSRCGPGALLCILCHLSHSESGWHSTVSGDAVRPGSRARRLTYIIFKTFNENISEI